MLPRKALSSKPLGRNFPIDYACQAKDTSKEPLDFLSLLWMVERLFRDSKTLLKTRPVFHKRDETIRGHAFCTFLGLVLLKELDRSLRAAGLELEHNEVMRDLKALQRMRIDEEGKG